MKNKRENGEVVVEASIVVTLVVIVISIMLYVGIIMYQQTLVSVMANQTAANIAQVYGNNLRDPFTGYVDSERIYQTVTYSNMKTDAYMDVVEQKANLFARYRLKGSRMVAASNTSVQVEVVKKPNELLKSQIVVKVDDHYDVPLVGLFGTDSLVQFSAVGRADCVDYLEYVNGVAAVGDPEESNVLFLPDAKTCQITFIPNRDNPSNSFTVTVMRGKSILTSNRYTHCTMPADPANGSHQFGGWIYGNNIRFTASTIVEDNIVVYGTWQCNVTLDANGGSVNGSTVHKMTVNLGSRASLPNAQRSNYRFDGWFTDPDGGTRYVSNDTPITGDVTLYAHWSCNHPSRYEVSRTGTICEGGIIKYKCTQCHIDLPDGSYPGNGHLYNYRCDQSHSWRWFRGNVAGGCGRYHTPGSCAACGITHSKVYAHCVVCRYCHYAKRSWWCGQPHAGGRNLPRVSPVNGHQNP